MIAYFARLLIKGVITALLSFMLIHTAVSYAPGGPAEIVHALTTGDGHPVPPHTNQIEMMPILELDRPWPASSLAWLFYPTETERYSRLSGTAISGINISIAGVHLIGSGVLTGDLGESLTYQPGTPVMDIIGRGTDEYLLAHLAVLFVAMIIACVQRRGRPRLHELPGRALPSIAATRSTVRAGATYIQHGEGPLALLTRL